MSTQGEAARDALRSEYSGQVATRSLLRAAICRLAETYIGTREEGNNGGPEVTAFLHSVNLPAGNPWCLAFIQYCYATACGWLGLPDILPYNTGGTQALWTWGTKQEAAFTNHRILKPADIIIWRNGDTANGHAGLCVAYDNNGTATTVEGNVSSGSWRDGGGVEHRTFPAGKYGLWGEAKSSGRWTRGALSFDVLYTKFIGG